MKKGKERKLGEESEREDEDNYTINCFHDIILLPSLAYTHYFLFFFPSPSVALIDPIKHVI